MQGIFDIVKKDDKMYIILKEDDRNCEAKVKDLLGEENLEFTDVFELVHNRMLRDLAEGISIFDNEPLIEKLGMKELTEIFYDLTGLGQSKKMLFNYALMGRRGSSGLLQTLGGGRLTKTAVFLPSENESEVETFIKKWKVKYTKRKVLVFEEE